MVKLLSEPAESVEDLAAEVILAIDDLRAKRTDYYVIVRDPGVGIFLHGPYVTKAAVQRAIEKGELFAASKGATGTIVRLQRSMDEGMELP